MERSWGSSSTIMTLAAMVGQGRDRNNTPTAENLRHLWIMQKGGWPQPGGSDAIV